MACVNTSNDENITYDSDEVHEMFCEQCDNHGVYATAGGFCVDCLEYMCDMCMVYHKRYLPGHTQEDRYTMPQDFCLDKCDSHQNKVIKFYCQKCDKFACTKCKEEEHTTCNLGHIPSLIHGNTLDVNTELTGLLEKIDNMSTMLDETKMQIDQNVSKVLCQGNDEKSKLQQEIVEKKKNFRRKTEDVINMFDRKMNETIAKLRKERQEKMEWLAEQNRIFDRKLSEGVKTVEFEIEKYVEADQAKLDDLYEECKEIKDDLKSFRYSLVLKQKIGQKSSLFVTTKNMQTDVAKCQQKITSLISKNATSDYEIQSEDVSLPLEPTRLTQGLHTFNKIVKSTDMKVAIINPNTSLKLPLGEKSEASTFSSLCVLSENKLLVANYKHPQLFVFKDLTESTPANVLSLSSNPWEITKITTDQIAVTFPDVSYILFITFSAENMELQHSNGLSVRGKCYGIACNGEHFFVSFIDPTEIRVITFKGDVIKRLFTPSDGGISLISPLFLTLNAKHSTVYISDRTANTVTCMTFDGKIKAIYKDDQLKNPLHMAVDGNGSVYVCGRQSNNIHRLSSDLKKELILLDRHEINRPVSVAYCTKRNTLYVGMKNGNAIKCFNIKAIKNC
ncbi:uncharacterized protein LOC123533285 [Mercenaria mercenaria]|uniref:uncharacterized protein LOC123533285 n=1 Tax=Mercenaria mercenaria TaxID=6596 RepID=UPI00234E57A1|nr:uncharacterized protein LOC123533285 [Mercenaria mercenaria]